MSEGTAPGVTQMTTHQRDGADVAERIATWLHGPQARVSDVHAPEGSGMSSVTVLFTVPGAEGARRLVARLAPDTSSFPVFPDYDLARQVEVMRAVGAYSLVPVPPVVALEETGSVLGTPFLVMEAVDGQAPGDNPPYVFGGWLYDASPAERRRLQDGTVSVIAGIHAVPTAAVPSLHAGGDALRNHVDAQRDYYEWTCADGVRVPILERAFDWLEAHWPADPGPAVLSWGDARPGNILFDAFMPAAVLDWEMAALAPREVDLAWVVFLHRFFQDIARVFELDGLPDFCRREDVVATYEEISGHPVRDFDWYVVYAALRHGIVMSKVKRRMIHFGEETRPDDPDDYVMHRATLAALIDGTYAWD